MKIYKSILFIVVFFVVFSCKKKAEETITQAENTAKPKTPVTIAYPSDTVNVTDNVTLNATSSYLLKSDVKANTNGYITKVTIRLADRVGRGQVLFALQTKEARALGNTINKLDPSFRFSGTTSVTSPTAGYVEMMNHQVGDYVQDGEVLATIADSSSFGFVMNVPYEYNQLVRSNNSIKINLPDGSSLDGYVAKIMPAVDPVSQTEKVLVKVRNGGVIPENLIGTINLRKTENTGGIYVPKTAVLSDETQSQFWVMKMKNDTTAVKVDIVKGIETNQWVQVVSGNILKTDRIVTSGNYGLEDTAFVTVTK